MSLDPDKIYAHIMECAKEWVSADEESRKLHELQPIILAEIFNRMDESASVAQRKSWAMASAEYKLHITNMVAAKTKANSTLARYKAAQNLAELRRSEESSRRAEMNIR